MKTDALGNFAGKSLVIFGAGYVGSALAETAHAAGIRVTALTRNSDAADRLRALGVQVIHSALQDANWHRALGAPDWAVNCVSSGGGGENGYRESYVAGFQSILQWLSRCHGKLDTLIYTSSTSVYPQAEGVVNENSSTEEAVGTPRILLEAEALAGSASAEGHCARAIVLRLAGIYGPGRHQLLDQLKKGITELTGTGDHVLNLIHRDDIVAAIVAALGAPPAVGSTIFNVVDDSPTPKKDVVSWLAEQLRLAAPGFSGVHASVRRAAGLNRSVSNEKIKRELGWAPRYSDYRAGYRAILQS